MNDTGGGVTAIHDVPGDITRIGFHWMLFFPFSHSKGGFYLFFTRSVSEVTGFLCPEFANFRIVSFTRRIAEITDFFVTNFRIFEFFSSHGMSRFFVPRLVLGPTDQREVIFEFSNCFFTRIVAE